MDFTYKACKSQIQRQSYATKADIQRKLDVFLLVDSINQSQYEELVELLGKNPEK